MDYPKSLQPLPKHAKKVFSGVVFDVWQWQQKMFDGSVQTFEKVSRRASVGILPITEDKKIILTIQEQPNMQQFISIVGGVVDPGEKIESAAHRELLEESGTQTNDLELLYSVQPITKVEWPIYLFVARNCKTVTEVNPDVGERIKLKYVTWQEFLEILYLDEFRDKELALHLLQLMRDKNNFKKLKDLLFK